MIFDDLLTALGRVCLTLRHLCVDIRDHALVPVDAFEVSLPALQNVRFEGAASGQWMNAIARGAPALERAVCRVIAAHGMPWGGRAVECSKPGPSIRRQDRILGGFTLVGSREAVSTLLVVFA